MNEKLRVKPILVGWVVLFIGGMATGFGVAYYSTGGDMAKMQKFAEEATALTHIGMALFSAFFALVGGYVTARMSPYDPGRHAKRLALVVVILAAIGVVVGAVTQGIGAQTLIGLLSAVASYGAVLLGGYLGTDDEAAS